MPCKPTIAQQRPAPDHGLPSVLKGGQVLSREIVLEYLPHTGVDPSSARGLDLMGPCSCTSCCVVPTLEESGMFLKREPKPRVNDGKRRCPCSWAICPFIKGNGKQQVRILITLRQGGDQTPSDSNDGIQRQTAPEAAPANLPSETPPPAEPTSSAPRPELLGRLLPCSPGHWEREIWSCLEDWDRWGTGYGGWIKERGRRWRL